MEVAKAEAITLTDDVSALGTLKSRQAVVVRPEVSGRIAKLGFANGQRVKKGQLLVQLDDTLQQAQLLQAQAQASIARTNLQRSRELLAQSFVSQSVVDQNISALQVAEAQTSLAQAQLARMKVFAPFDATAGIGDVDVGSYVKDGADIVKLEDMSALVVQFSLPERYVSRLKVGQPVDVALDALPGKALRGQIVALDSQVDPNGRALLVNARIDNPGGLLKPGMFARPRVVFAIREGAVVVPEEALVPLGAKQFIFKVVDGPGGGPNAGQPGGPKISQRLEARIGLRLPGKVEILSGLVAGDAVVTAGHARLLRADGVPLRVVDLSRAAAGGPPAGKPAAAAGASAALASGVKPAAQP